MTASSRPALSHLLDFSDRNNQRAHDILIVRQARRLLRDGTDDSDSLRTDVRQQLKRLISLDSQSEILELLFDTDYLKLETIETFIEEILQESHKTSHLHNPQEIVHLQEFCNNALHLLRIYRVIEQYRSDRLMSSDTSDDLFFKEVTSNVREENACVASSLLTVGVSR